MLNEATDGRSSHFITLHVHILSQRFSLSRRGPENTELGAIIAAMLIINKLTTDRHDSSYLHEVDYRWRLLS